MDKEWFRTRTEIADHFEVTRMTLHRWEKILSLARNKNDRVWMSLSDIKKWYMAMSEKRRKAIFN